MWKDSEQEWHGDMRELHISFVSSQIVQSFANICNHSDLENALSEICIFYFFINLSS